VTDPLVIGAWVDGILLVLRASVTTSQQLSAAADLLRDVGTPVLGTVMTGSDSRFAGHPHGSGASGSGDMVPSCRVLPPGISGRITTEVVRPGGEERLADCGVELSGDESSPISSGPPSSRWPATLASHRTSTGRIAATGRDGRVAAGGGLGSGGAAPSDRPESG
jgi:hypothetical protein